jgi:methionyl-tRNA formyltransferase
MLGDPDLVVRPVHETILTKAGEYGIPVLEVGSMRNEETLYAIQELEPDLVVVACFPQILPKRMLEIPKFGCLNVHPSLLPAYRGPEPLFWQFRAGEKDMGVTVHWMDAGADTGDILGQVHLSFPEGARTVEADGLVAQAGAELILRALQEDEWPRRPQESEGASYQGIPGTEDRVIPVSWDVKRAFNFIRGADVWAPFWIEREDGDRVTVQEALGFDVVVRIEDGVDTRAAGTRVQMRDGVLRVAWEADD